MIYDERSRKHMDEQRNDKAALNKQKKVVLIIIGALVLFAILYFIVSTIDFDSLFNKKSDISDFVGNYYFYDESMSKYPSEDEWYMTEAFKEVEYSHGVSTVISEILFDEKDAAAKGKPVELLYNLVEYIKAGDYEGYNSCFSSYYYQTSQPQGPFTKQKIYDITITELSSQTKSADGTAFIEYTYTLEYRIRHNNGTLRKDIGSDQIRKQYIVLSERAGEGILIDMIYILVDTVES